ncbi:DUF1501 domain-containing protein [Bryobacter aggregatus]|uniref:DUF1501 domain-containing protein n=1 Tax=Bryobacter aggregatus TaxID=360054 RepID=UPI0004E0E51B|nr:DUF1501 domain-containing protein [Bryobacter aggregatus]
MWSKDMESSRRKFFLNAGKGFGSLAFASMISRAAEQARAKNVIFLFMHGGVSQVDTFDPKPTLTRLSGQPLPGSVGEGLITSRIDFRKALMRGSPWNFQRGGKSGLEISDLFPEIRKHADKLAVVRSCYGDAFDHAPAIYLRASGSQFPGKPSLGAWSVYGLGSENRNLPSFVVMSDGAMKSGSGAYGSGFLPAVYQGTVFRTGKSPVLHLASPDGVSDVSQRETLDLITRMNKKHYASREEDTTLDARISSYELAYRMQSEAPDVVDLSTESDATRKLYGIGEAMTDDFGRKCLLARRLVERGVRFVQLYSGTNLGDDWDDAHNDLLGSHNKMAKKSDLPIAGLLADLEGRGLLSSTLVVWSTEFGRTPLAEGKNGRDHHPYGFSMWMAGAGIQGGRALGATDEFGLRAVEERKSVHDMHATIFRLLGLDHTKVTYRFQGRDQRLTDVHGEGEFTDWLLKSS